MYENLKNKVIFVTGLPGSGKKKFAVSLSDNVIFLDKYRYLENWTRKDNKDYLDEINRKLDNLKNEEKIVICGNYDDPDDIQNTNINLIHELSKCGCITKVYIMEIVCQVKMIASLIKIYGDRLVKNEKHISGNKETSKLTAYYILLNSNKYTQISNNLINLSRFCQENQIDLYSDYSSY
jgi:hypothetical protein